MLSRPLGSVAATCPGTPKTRRAGAASPCSGARRYLRPWIRQNRPVVARRPQGLGRDEPPRSIVPRARHVAPPVQNLRNGASGAPRVAPAVRQRARRGPCDDGLPGWRGRRGCAYAAGNRGSSHGAGCSAGKSACSRGTPRTSGRYTVYVLDDAVLQLEGCSSAPQPPVYPPRSVRGFAPVRARESTWNGCMTLRRGPPSGQTRATARRACHDMSLSGCYVYSDAGALSSTPTSGDSRSGRGPTLRTFRRRARRRQATDAWVRCHCSPQVVENYVDNGSAWHTPD